jgi:ribonuclease HI
MHSPADRDQIEIGGAASGIKAVDIYTDGACLGNPGPGGWGVLLRYGAREKELSGGAAATTNNRMELTAVIEGLRALRTRCRVTVYSDSRYVVDAMRKGWARGWRARGWQRADKQPALNPDLWGELLTLCETQDVTFVWVRGHADNPDNNRCDALATAAAAAQDPA